MTLLSLEAPGPYPTRGLIPGPGRFHMLQSSCATTIKTCMPWRPCSATGEASAPQRRVDPAWGNLRKSTCSSEDPTQQNAINEIIKNLEVEAFERWLCNLELTWQYRKNMLWINLPSLPEKMHETLKCDTGVLNVYSLIIMALKLVA